MSRFNPENRGMNKSTPGMPYNQFSVWFRAPPTDGHPSHVAVHYLPWVSAPAQHSTWKPDLPVVQSHHGQLPYDSYWVMREMKNRLLKGSQYGGRDFGDR